jgi:hypothetical protein
VTIAPIKPSMALYIKLGRGGRWESDCIKRDQTLRLGYREVSHDLCLQGRWDKVREELLKTLRKSPGAATRDTYQIRLFYESDESVLWITFFGDRLYWCFSKPEVALLPDKSKTRPAIGMWSCEDIEGRSLQKSQLSGRLLSMQGFQGTICSVKESEYLVQKINGHIPEEVEEAQVVLSELERKIETIIQSLHWKDFEVLIDLIFRQAGWQRVSELGETLKTLDLDLVSPITSERYGVQVKSRAGLAEFEDYQQRFADMQGYTRLYFVVHTPSRDLEDLAQSKIPKDIELWLPQDIAHRAVMYGLTDWIITKAS